MIRVCAIVCANGLGHYKRTLAVIDALLSTLRPVTPLVTIVCARSQVERLADWPVADRVLTRANIRTGIVEHGVAWHQTERPYTDGRLMNWEDNLNQVQELFEADLVLSDNLTGTLRFRPDAVLMGSFLWSEVLEDAFPRSPYVQEFVAHERSLLESTTPPMICLDAVATPDVRAFTRPVPLGFMCGGAQSEFRTPPARQRPSIAVLGGTTGTSDLLLISAARSLGSLGYEVAVPSQLKDQAPDLAAMKSFAFDQKAFAATDVIVARPGVGTITDAVCHGIPMVFTYERNFELEWNAKALTTLGMARDAGINATGNQIVTEVLHLLEDQNWQATTERLKSADREGLERSAVWLSTRLGAIE